MSTLDAENLMIPEKIVKLIPPRPMGYQRHREVIKIRTNLTFDPLAAVEAAADMTASLLLDPAKAARLLDYNARNAEQPSLIVLIDQLVDHTFKNVSKGGYVDAVQITINDAVLVNLFRLALSKEVSLQVKAVVMLKLNQLKSYLQAKNKEMVSEQWKAHYLNTINEIETFQTSPEKFVIPTLLIPPPGQPIGSLGCNDY
jgi:hypothetical protein